MWYLARACHQQLHVLRLLNDHWHDLRRKKKKKKKKKKPISYSFWAWDLKRGSYLVQLIPNNNLLVSNFWIRSSIWKYADNYVLNSCNCDRKYTIVSIILN